MQAGKDGEDRFFTGLYLLVQYLVGLIERRQSGRSVDDGNGIDIVHLLFAKVDDGAQLLRRSCS